MNAKKVVFVREDQTGSDRCFLVKTLEGLRGTIEVGRDRREITVGDRLTLAEASTFEQTHGNIKIVFQTK